MLARLSHTRQKRISGKGCKKMDQNDGGLERDFDYDLNGLKKIVYKLSDESGESVAISSVVTLLQSVLDSVLNETSEKESLPHEFLYAAGLMKRLAGSEGTKSVADLSVAMFLGMLFAAYVDSERRVLRVETTDLTAADLPDIEKRLDEELREKVGEMTAVLEVEANRTSALFDQIVSRLRREESRKDPLESTSPND